jgi:amino acid adenylation domain-containing protein
MDAAALVAQLAARGIELRLDGDRVLVHGERRLLTRELQLQLAAQKQAILAYLKAKHESGTASADAPLSDAQQRLWFLDQMQPGQAAYTLGMAERLDGPLDVQALQTALTNLVARHEILRTTFPAVDGQPVQRVAPPYPVELPVIDLSSLSASEQDGCVVQEVEAQLARPFDLASDRLLRATLLRLGDASHVFALSVHHTIGDGWSVAIVGHELAELYAAAVQHRAAVLPPVERQYRDYAIGQAEWMRSSAPAQEVRHWTNVLDDVPRVLALPGDRTRPALAGSRGGRVEFMVDAAVAASLRTLSRRHNSTLFMTLLGAFGVLLGRHAGLQRLAIATPIAGRHREQDATLIGCLVNTLPLVVDLRGEPSFVELLARVRDVTLDAYDHQDLPFERLVEELHPERDLSRNPIVQVSFGLHNAPGQTPYASLPLHALEATPLDVAASTVRFDVELDAWEVDGGLHCRLLYARELFDAAAMQSFAAQFTTLLQGIAADPALSVSRIRLLSAERRDAVIAHGQRAFRGAPAFLGNPDTALLHELVFAQAARIPDAIAIVCGRDSLTYGELAQRARDLADRLRDAGVVADTPVALCVDRSLHTVPAMLAILDAGGAYVPIDPEHPAERIDLVLADCAATIVVTESALADRFANRNITVICADQTARMGGGTTAIHPDGETLAYLMYTSGSTGRPKGVEVPHRAVTGMLRAVNEVIALSGEDVFLAVTTIAFDISVLELFLPLISGAQLVLATREEVVDGARLVAALERHAVTMMQATPATWRLLLASDWSGHRRLTLLCGGEALPPALAAELLPRCESVLNLYGPTETTIWSSVDRVFASEPITIGGPLSNSTLYILDQHLEPVPPGVAGELWIGGSGVTRGYHARPDLTLERYLPDPFSVVQGARIYRTGDLARQRADGRIECLGRVDQQVKLRGFRIEPGEIEAALLAHAGAREAVVVLHGASPDEQRLVAYVVPADVDATADAVREALRTRLPAYLIPSDVVLLHELPRTPNGKLDRASLPSPMRAIPNERITPPGSDAERVIAEIWSAVLNVPQVGVRDNFFDLGGHSLLMMRVRAQIAERLGVELPVVDLFRLPTIRAVAEHIAGTTAATTVVDADVVAARQLAAIGRFAHAAQGREQER